MAASCQLAGSALSIPGRTIMAQEVSQPLERPSASVRPPTTGGPAPRSAAMRKAGTNAARATATASSAEPHRTRSAATPGAFLPSHSDTA
jgi:hypothetical protein